MTILHVLHLVGSPTSQALCELSELYCADCIHALQQPGKYHFAIALVRPDGLWRFPDGLSRSAIGAAQPMTAGEAIQQLAGQQIDIALPQIFCLAGMTHYRALLETLGIAYLGNRPFQMAPDADKAMCRAVVGTAGVRVPKAEHLRSGQLPVLAPPGGREAQYLGQLRRRLPGDAAV